MGMRIGVVFVAPEVGERGYGEDVAGFFSGIRREVMSKLREVYPDVEFLELPVGNAEGASAALQRAQDAVGYMVFSLNSPWLLARPFAWSGKPVVLIAETYGGSGDLLPEYSRAREQGLPVVVAAARNEGIAEEGFLRRYAGYLRAIGRLRSSKVVVVVGPELQKVHGEVFPLAIDMMSYFRSIQAIFGITPIVMDVREFVEKYYGPAAAREAEVDAIVGTWMGEATEVAEDNVEEVRKSAKLYLAMEEAVRERGADAMAVHCLPLYRAGYLQAWPCLGFMELVKRGEAVPACEADVHAASVLLLMKHLADRPGFISDTALDTAKGEMVYYHCFAPITPYRYGGPERVPYAITPAHMGGKRASVRVEMPTGVATAVGLSVEERALIVHRVEVTGNERSEYACATKVVGRSNVRAIAGNWRWRSGWHRVLFYGDWREELRDMAALLGLRYVEEDA